MMTREEERKELEKIRKIYNGLDKNGYVFAALEGVIELAEDNIGNDFCISFPEKLERLEKENAELSTANAKHMAEAQQAKTSLEQCRKYAGDASARSAEARHELQEARAELERKDAEIVALKAKLYDLMTA